MAALTRAGSQGLLIRSGRALEQLVDVDVVIFDKTGTLTEGHPSVVHFAIFDSDGSLSEVVSDARRRELLQLSTSLEQGLNHPIAKAIRDSAEQERLMLLNVTPGITGLDEVLSHNQGPNNFARKF
ncbi:MAG: hypothetical protein CM15mP116_08800 [Synechococcus sp.]|nr:MAG: hypothetical protein CM15mP116_08800 [Synechococcus sp.]